MGSYRYNKGGSYTDLNNSVYERSHHHIKIAVKRGGLGKSTGEHYRGTTHILEDILPEPIDSV